MELVGVAEVAGMLDVTRQRVHELLRSDAEFPAPVAELAAGRIWHRSDIEGWMVLRERSQRGVQMAEVSGVVVVTASSYADAGAIADAVRESRAVAVDLRAGDVMLVRRVIDFVSGAASVVGGTMERLGERVYVVCPKDRKLTKRQREALAEHLA